MEVYKFKDESERSRPKEKITIKMNTITAACVERFIREAERCVNLQIPMCIQNLQKVLDLALNAGFGSTIKVD